MKTEFIRETATTIISEGTRVDGSVRFEHVARVHGTLAGDVKADPGSTLILGETAVVEGNIEADVLMVNGYVQGDITATTRVKISGTGRVIGNIRTPSLLVDFGAYFEGDCTMDPASSGRAEGAGGGDPEKTRKSSTAKKPAKRKAPEKVEEGPVAP